MKFKFLTVAAILLLSLWAGSINAATTLEELGRHPFYKPPLTSAEDLLSMISSRQAEIEEGLIKAGRPDLFESLMEQYQTADVRTVDFVPGQGFEWMFFKTRGKGNVKIARDVVLGNEKTIPGYQFEIESMGQRYILGFPVACGNLALLTTRNIPVPMPVAAPNRPPDCRATFTRSGPFCDDSITVDASGSADPDGSISIAAVKVLDESGKVVLSKTLDGPPFVGDITVPCGKHQLQVTVTDDNGEEVTSTACAGVVQGLKRNRIIADMAFLHQRDPANYVQARVGLRHRFTEEFAVLGLVGLAPKVHGDDGESAVVADLLGMYYLDRLSLGLGVGAWLTNGDSDVPAEDSQIDLIADIGFRVYGDPEEFNTALFIEARSGVDELDDAWKYGRYGGGVRFEF